MRPQTVDLKKSFILSLILTFFVIAAFGQTTAQVQLKKISEIKTDGGKSELDQWREDLHFIATELPARHKNLFHRLDRDKFERAVKDLDARLPTLTRNQVALEFERLVGMARDGHTWVSPIFSPNMNFHLFPVNMYMFENDIYIRKAAPEYKNIVGGRVLKIGKMPIKEAYERVAPYMSTDNEMGIMSMAPNYLGSPEVLQALGITDSLDKATFEIEKDGRVFTAEVKLPEGRDNSMRAVHSEMKSWADARDGAKNPLPLTWKKTDQQFWFEYLKDEKILYVQLNAVLNDENKTLAGFFEEVFDFAGKNKPGKFVLDIRFNGGGNNTLIRPIIRGLIKLDEIDRPGHLFVIIGRRTFSAAQNLTNELETWTNAVFIGEPTASHVNMYGDARRFELPNSKMPIYISELWWQNKHARDERKWTAPNVAAELTFADYARNIDPAMEAIRNYQPRRSLREAGLAIYQSGDLKGLKQFLIDFRKDPANKYYNVEEEVNGFGYNLIRMQKLDDAVEIFKINVELYPESFNVYDSLAEAYMLKGEKDLAMKFYKKSLELNPNNTNATEMIKKMEDQNKER